MLLSEKIAGVKQNAKAQLRQSGEGQLIVRESYLDVLTELQVDAQDQEAKIAELEAALGLQVMVNQQMHVGERPPLPTKEPRLSLVSDNTKSGDSGEYY